MRKIKIGDKVIGGESTYVIAEFGVNHNGSLERALDAIRKAAKAGADAIKFQTYTADELVVKDTPKFWDWEGDRHFKNQHEAYKFLGGFPMDYYPELIKCCEENKIEFLSTPFSPEAATALYEMGMRAFKIASSDMSYHPFLQHIARMKRPIFLSTGASTMEEIHEAVEVILKTGNDKIVVLQCTLNYPTAHGDANLNIIGTLKKAFPNLVIGLSDHTLGSLSSIIAAAKGAKVIEKHFTVDKSLPDSADHWLSVDPKELGEIVKGVRLVEQLSGSDRKEVLECEKETRMYDKRSIVSKVDIPEGTMIRREMLAFKRPGTGIWPQELGSLLGRRAKTFIKSDTVLQWTHV